MLGQHTQTSRLWSQCQHKAIILAAALQDVAAIVQHAVWDVPHFNDHGLGLTSPLGPTLLHLYSFSQNSNNQDTQTFTVLKNAAGARKRTRARYEKRGTADDAGMAMAGGV
jgi:hypothetical protein